MTVSVEHHLEATPGVRAGRPRLSGTRITVDDVVILHVHLGRRLDEIAADLDASLAALYAAMAYYFDHRGEIDQQIEADSAYVDAMKKSSPSVLQAKLKALRGE